MNKLKELSKSYGSHWTFSIFLLVLFLSCSPSEKDLIGAGGGPYVMTLSGQENGWITGQKAVLSFQLIDTRNGGPVEGLQLAHERLMHIFITNDQFDYFSHLHVDKITQAEDDSGRFQVIHTFQQSGIYHVVAEFVHQNRIWNKSFRLVVGGPSRDDPGTYLEPQDGYTAELAKPERISPGEEVEFTLEVRRNGELTRNLQLFLGSELHGAIWRGDWKQFGHLHSFTPRMQVLIDKIRKREGLKAISPVKLQEVLIEVMCSTNELVFTGPTVPLRYTFPSPGDYYLFAQVAPDGVPRTFRFLIEVEFPHRD